MTLLTFPTVSQNMQRCHDGVLNRLEPSRLVLSARPCCTRKQELLMPDVRPCLQNMPRPFKPLRELDMDELTKKIVSKLKK